MAPAKELEERGSLKLACSVRRCFFCRHQCNDRRHRFSGTCWRYLPARSFIWIRGRATRCPEEICRTSGGSPRIPTGAGAGSGCGTPSAIFSPRWSAPQTHRFRAGRSPAAISAGSQRIGAPFCAEPKAAPPIVRECFPQARFALISIRRWGVCVIGLLTAITCLWRSVPPALSSHLLCFLTIRPK